MSQTLTVLETEETPLINAKCPARDPPQSKRRAQVDREKKPGDIDLLALREGLESTDAEEKPPQKERSLATKARSFQMDERPQCEKPKLS